VCVLLWIMKILLMCVCVVLLLVMCIIIESYCDNYVLMCGNSNIINVLLMCVVMCEK